MRRLCVTLGLISLLLLSMVSVGFAACEGNLNCDYDTDGADLAIFAADFGATGCGTCDDVLNRINDLEDRIDQLETLLQNVSRTGNVITFGGVNVQIVNGTGTTYGTPNGFGNLIVGYDSDRDTDSDKTGSHNIVVGDNHNYSSYGGLVAGYDNTISAQYATVTGGLHNWATAEYASVSGGGANTASVHSASVSGGQDNEASAWAASVSGGSHNTAVGGYSSVSGGRYNVASGLAASVSGGGGGVDTGLGNAAIGDYSSVSGGGDNVARGSMATVAGGRGNRAVGEGSFIGGGGDDWSNGNTTWSKYSTIVGGRLNDTGRSGEPERGVYATMTGGFSNIAYSTNLNQWMGGNCYTCYE